MLIAGPLGPDQGIHAGHGLPADGIRAPDVQAGVLIGVPPVGVGRAGHIDLSLKNADGGVTGLAGAVVGGQAQGPRQGGAVPDPQEPGQGTGHDLTPPGEGVVQVGAQGSDVFDGIQYPQHRAPRFLFERRASRRSALQDGVGINIAQDPVFQLQEPGRLLASSSLPVPEDIPDHLPAVGEQQGLPAEEYSQRQQRRGEARRDQAGVRVQGRAAEQPPEQELDQEKQENVHAVDGVGPSRAAV